MSTFLQSYMARHYPYVEYDLYRDDVINVWRLRFHGHSWATGEYAMPVLWGRSAEDARLIANLIDRILAPPPDPEPWQLWSAYV